MTEYICKCQLTFNKNVSADTTGYRAVENCTGCPYRMDYGQYAWDSDRRAMVEKVEGQECIASRAITYDTTLEGPIDGKTSLRIYSLDFDFLDEVCHWANAQPDGVLCVSFDREKIRRSEFAACGRYRMSILPAQNKQGIAAKQALAARFFTEDRHRKDMAPEDEKAKILSDIANGKMKAATGSLQEAAACADTPEETADVPEVCTDCKCRTCANDGCDFWTGGCNETDIRECSEDGCFTEECNDWIPKEDGICTTETGTSDPALPADAGLDEPACAAALPAALDAASLTATAVSAPEQQPNGFDYSGLDVVTVDTLHVAERMIFEGRRDYIIQVAQAVSIAHEVLVANCDKRSNQYSDDTFRAWCAFMGFSKDTAYRLMQVNELLNGATPEELATLENASPSLLYAAARPSAPPQLVQAVKDGDITSHKEYQAALAQISRLREANEGLEKANSYLQENVRELQTGFDDARRIKEAAEKRAAAAESAAADARQRAEAAEARPVEVVGAAPEDIERWRAEGAAQAQREIETMRKYIERRETELEAEISCANEETKKARQAAKQASDTLKGRTDHLRAVERELERKNQLLNQMSDDATVDAVPCCKCVYERNCLGMKFMNMPEDQQIDLVEKLTGCTAGRRKKEES